MRIRMLSAIVGDDGAVWERGSLRDVSPCVARREVALGRAELIDVDALPAEALTTAVTLRRRVVAPETRDPAYEGSMPRRRK